MRTKEHCNVIVVSVVDVIEFSAREAGFLRQMAQYCIDTKMAGYGACERLVEIFDRAQVQHTGPWEPVYGLFEAPDPGA